MAEVIDAETGVEISDPDSLLKYYPTWDAASRTYRRRRQKKLPSFDPVNLYTVPTHFVVVKIGSLRLARSSSEERESIIEQYRLIFSLL